MQPQPYFDPNAKQYRTCCCCCCSCQALTGAKVVAILELIYACFWLAISIAGIATGSGSRANQIIGIVGFVVLLVVSILVLVGCSKERHPYLMPFLVVMMIQIIIAIIEIVLIILVMVGVGVATAAAEHSTSGGTTMAPQTKTVLNIVGWSVSGVMIFIYLIGLLIAITYFVVVLRGYRYLRDKYYAVGPATMKYKAGGGV